MKIQEGYDPRGDMYFVIGNAVCKTSGGKTVMISAYGLSTPTKPSRQQIKDGEFKAKKLLTEEMRKRKLTEVGT